MYPQIRQGFKKVRAKLQNHRPAKLSCLILYVSDVQIQAKRIFITSKSKLPVRLRLVASKTFRKVILPLHFFQFSVYQAISQNYDAHLFEIDATILVLVVGLLYDVTFTTRTA